ncbi:hypothetical protein [Amycolatopsis sp. GM8]|uniref:hypothetical protein n=1 Tax=Amycolatopsis sp. GM8 TaxID=2896530 RepID=UPI001F36C76D|nr:hypothetical protein [Amycolatopsis sp. GM8]
MTTAVLIAVLVAGSGSLTDTPPPAVAVEPVPTTTAAETTPTFDASGLPRAVSDAVNDVVPHTDLGFALFDTRAGRTIAALDADEPFYTASLVKLLIALDVLSTGDWHVPAEPLRADLTAMIAASHDGIAESLWNSGGRSAIVTRMAKIAGLQHTRPPAISDQWEMTSTTASDIVTLYRYLTTQVPLAARDLILGAMAAATNPAADGFAQYFGIPDGLPGEKWAIKQGWMEIQRAVVLNTSGLVGSRYVVVLLAELPLSTSYVQGRAAVTAGIAAVAPALTEQPLSRKEN